jgi:hypothetical protein
MAKKNLESYAHTKWKRTTSFNFLARLLFLHEIRKRR